MSPMVTPHLLRPREGAHHHEARGTDKPPWYPPSPCAARARAALAATAVALRQTRTVFLSVPVQGHLQLPRLMGVLSAGGAWCQRVQRPSSGAAGLASARSAQDESDPDQEPRSQQPRPWQQPETSASPRPATACRGKHPTEEQAVPAKHANGKAPKQLKARESRRRTVTRKSSGNADGQRPDAAADRRPDGPASITGTAASVSRPPAEQPAAQVFMCRVSAPSKTTADAATQWKARPLEPSLDKASASEASTRHPPARDASSAVEAANRSLAKLERLVKEQHQQACYTARIAPHAARYINLMR